MISKDGYFPVPTIRRELKARPRMVKEERGAGSVIVPILSANPLSRLLQLAAAPWAIRPSTRRTLCGHGSSRRVMGRENESRSGRTIDLQRVTHEAAVIPRLEAVMVTTRGDFPVRFTIMRRVYEAFSPRTEVWAFSRIRVASFGVCARVGSAVAAAPKAVTARSRKETTPHTASSSQVIDTNPNRTDSSSTVIAKATSFLRWPEAISRWLFVRRQRRTRETSVEVDKPGMKSVAVVLLLGRDVEKSRSCPPLNSSTASSRNSRGSTKAARRQSRRPGYWSPAALRCAAGSRARGRSSRGPSPRPRTGRRCRPRR